LLSFRAAQLAFAACPAEALDVINDVDIDALSAPPAVLAAWGQVIACGDLILED
jgi:hypothetical protein